MSRYEHKIMLAKYNIVEMCSITLYIILNKWGTKLKIAQRIITCHEL